MQAIENFSFQNGISNLDLIKNSGLLISNFISERFSNESDQILVLLGSGTNGSDGIVAASNLIFRGYDVSIVILRPRLKNDKDLQRLYAQQESQIFDYSDNQSKFSINQFTELINKSDVIVDAVFGTGLSRPINLELGKFFKIIQDNQSTKSIISVDLPSGLNPDNGKVDPSAISADFTLALGFPKLGHFNPLAIEYVGELNVLDIGLNQEFEENILTRTISTPSFNEFPVRKLNSNKGTFGKTLIIGGSKNFPGSVSLAANAAYRVGSGLIEGMIPANIIGSFSALTPEAIVFPLPIDQFGEMEMTPTTNLSIASEINQYSSILLGCGLGISAIKIQFVQNLLFSSSAHSKFVIDADALNILSNTYKWWDRFSTKAVLTPHLKEMARLTRMSILDIQNDRVEVVRHFAQYWNKIIVLKGAFTLIGFPTGEVLVNTESNPLLSTAGTGDVLAGMIAGFVSQGLSLEKSSELGVFIHSEIAKNEKHIKGTSGLLASDLVNKIPEVINVFRDKNG